MAERIPDSLIDEILASTKKYMQEETEQNETEKTESVVTEKTVVVPSFRKEKKEFSLNIKDVTFAEEEQVEEVTEKTGDVGVLITDDGQIGLMSDGVEISSEAEETEEETEEKEELKSVSGQISIEKTRMFNEVEIRGAYNPNISHNLGNKVTRTTTGEAQPLSSSAIGEEKYRKHFMNKPVQNLEKTQEHRDLIASLPQKTIETPGVVVKKNKQISTNTDGVEPIPTIVPAEYELEQEKTRFIVTEPEEVISDNQIMLDGFGNDDEPVIIQSEEQAEEELRIKRKDKVKEFKKYLGDEIPKRFSSFPFYKFYQDMGFQVIGVPSALGDPDDDENGMPNFVRSLENIRAFADKCKKENSMGMITSSWHNFPHEILLTGIMQTAQNCWKK